MATAPLTPPIPSSLASSKCHPSSRSKLPPFLTPSPQNSLPLLPSQKRRELLLKAGLGLLPMALVESILKVPSAEAKDAVVGSYLPPSPSDSSFVVFKATAKDTPALRAGTLFTFVISCFIKFFFFQ